MIIIKNLCHDDDESNWSVISGSVTTDQMSGRKQLLREWAGEADRLSRSSRDSLTEAAARSAGAALLLVRVTERVERRARRHARAGGHGAAERVARRHLGARLLEAEATRAVVAMHLLRAEINAKSKFDNGPSIIRYSIKK